MLTFHRWASGLLLACLTWTLPALAAGPAPAAAPAQPLPPAPIKVLLLPSDIKIYSIGLGSTDEASDDSAKMTAVTDAELQRLLAESASFKLQAMPTLSADEQATLKQHVALYRIEAGEAFVFESLGGVWKAQLKDFDYSLGPGLGFLRRSGADYALEVFGGDGQSTGANILLGNRRGRNHLYAGLVELATGNILWLHHEDHNSANFTAKNNMQLFVGELLGSYPVGSVRNSSLAH